jgi:hypothetical protein
VERESFKKEKMKEVASPSWTNEEELSKEVMKNGGREGEGRGREGGRREGERRGKRNSCSLKKY